MRKKFLVSYILFCLLIATCTITKERTFEINLPEGTTLETAQEILKFIVEDGFNEKISKKFTNIDPSKHELVLLIQLRDMAAFVIVGIKYEGKLDSAVEIAEYSKTIAEESINNYFKKKA